MKHKFYIIVQIYLLLFILFISCNNNTSKKEVIKFKDINSVEFESNIKTFTLSDANPQNILIENFNGNQNLNLSAIFDTVTFVRLSNEEDAIIGNINKILISDSCIYVLDRYKTKSIKKFSYNGNFLSIIGKHGEGPKEYIEPTDFIVSDNEIIVYDQFKSDLKFYDLDGAFKYDKKLPFLFLKFSCFSPNHYVFQSLDADNDHLQSIVNKSIFESDSSFVLSNSGFYRPKNKYISFIEENNFFPYKDKIYYHPPFNDTIYSINADHHISVEFIMDFQKKKLPDDYLLKENEKKLLKMMDTNQYAIFPGNYVPTEDYLYFQYSIEHLVYKGLYSNRTKKIIIGNSFFNDINYIFSYDNIIASTDNNILIGYMQSYLIEDSFDKHARNDWVKHIGEGNTRIAENTKSEDN
ncbi:MAG: 6-bladed beta-propeller, partial [Bacteroidales bacterium]|nr:6-bladed beta-propeller [Bacteroidales bacterium]